MHQFIQIVGALIAIAGLAVAGLALANGVTSATWMVLAFAAGIALPGAMLYCFGAIVEHLVVIRENSRRQLALFETLVGRKASDVPDMSKWSQRDRERYEAQQRQ